MLTFVLIVSKDIDHLDLYCYGGNSMNFRLNNESLFLIPKNDPSNVEVKLTFY